MLDNKTYKDLSSTLIFSLRNLSENVEQVNELSNIKVMKGFENNVAFMARTKA